VHSVCRSPCSISTAAQRSRISVLRMIMHGLHCRHGRSCRSARSAPLARSHFAVLLTLWLVWRAVGALRVLHAREARAELSEAPGLAERSDASPGAEDSGANGLPSIGDKSGPGDGAREGSRHFRGQNAMESMLFRHISASDTS
jgi:hypothetical protein